LWFSLSQSIIIIRLVAHSSHLAQLLDFCVFGIFKVLYKRENKVKELKGETVQIYCALAAFYKSAIIPMVRWGVVRAGFRLNPDNPFAPVSLHPEIAMERISLHEISLQECIESETLRLSLWTDRTPCKRFQISAPYEFAVRLQAYLKRGDGACPLCGHSEEKDSLEEETASE
jgi:hypothetical protein